MIDKNLLCWPKNYILQVHLTKKFMASEHSMDVVVKFDAQELRNAVDQAKKEILNRYDMKGSNIEIELNETEVKINVGSENQIESVYDILAKRVAGRGLSPAILDRQKAEASGTMRFKQEMKLLKVLDPETAKLIAKLIRDNFPKIKSNIQGTTVRVTSKSIDELQGVMQLLRQDPSVKMPIEFTNFR